jgi:SAM-dependent MidA family methyltransferase
LEPGGGACIVVANEFLDTLPVSQSIMHTGQWRTRCVGLDAEGALTLTVGEAEPAPRLPAGLPAPSEGDVFEERELAFADLAGQLAALGSPLAALFIDYGHAQPGFGDTLQAVSGQHYADPLASPGEADLTSHIDFAAFAAEMASRGFGGDGPVPQAAFLGRLGIVERASRLMAANPGKAAQIEADVARLMAPGGMGGRFQAIVIRSIDLPPLPALSAVDRGGSAP